MAYKEVKNNSLYSYFKGIKIGKKAKARKQ